VKAVIKSNHEPASEPRSPRSYIALSIGAAVITIALKVAAYLLTNSVGLFSDAAESVINLIAALAAFWALTVADRPPDEEHTYGHTKAEYFSSGLEGALILVAAGAIAITALNRFLHPQPLQNIGIGLFIALLSAAINGGMAVALIRAGQRLRSITLRADGYHLLADVWTTGGVLVGVLLVQFTGLLWLDPLVAMLVALNIAWTSFRLIRETAHGLLDTALPADDQAVIKDVLARYEREGIHFHAVRTRVSGQRRFVSMHVLVPGSWTIHDGHELCERIEYDIRSRLPKITVFTHLEPVEDPRSMADQELDRVTARN
jgi:cation diffusion facilitator family transporter